MQCTLSSLSLSYVSEFLMRLQGSGKQDLNPETVL
jgi:hypothetical protein